MGSPAKSMPIALPLFRVPYLEQIELCGAFDITDDQTSAWIEGLNGFFGIAPYSIGESDAWLRVTIDLFEKCVAHLHLDAAMPAYFGLTAPKQTCDLDQIFAHIGKLAGLSGAAALSARLTIPQNDLPPAGIVLSLTGVRSVVGSAVLVLSGAKMDVDGPPPIKSVRWSLQKSSVCVDLEGYIESVAIHENYMLDAVDMVNEGVARLLLEEEEYGSGSL